MLLLVGQGLAKSHQSGSLCPVRVGLELFQLLVDLQAVQVLDLGADQCRGHAGGVGVFDVRDNGLVRSDPGFLGGLPLIQRAADLLLKRFQGFAHPLALGVDQLRDFLQLGHQLLAGVVQGHFRLGDLEGDRGDGLTAFSGAGVWNKCQNLVTNLLQPRLQAVRRAVHGQRGFLWWHGGQFGCCVHVHPLCVIGPVQGTLRNIAIQAKEVADLLDRRIDPHLGGLAFGQSDRFPLSAPGGARLVVVEEVSRRLPGPAPFVMTPIPLSGLGAVCVACSHVMPPRWALWSGDVPARHSCDYALGHRIVHPPLGAVVQIGAYLPDSFAWGGVHGSALSNWSPMMRRRLRMRAPWALISLRSSSSLAMTLQVSSS
ncbi:hypothetical protein D3C84_681830 [compost metagenome]